MNRVLISLMGLLVLECAFCGPLYAASTAKVTARVVDENGVQIQGAEVSAGYTLAKKGGWGTDDYSEKGRSDKEGLFTATGETIIPQVTIHAQYPGYYRSSKWAKFTSRSLLLRRWEPWNPTVEVVLKKKRNPVAMYMKGTHGMKIPAFDKAIGFDLEKGDWVAPYGKGVIKDFIFNMHVVDRAYTDYDCSFSLMFSNKLDGIQEYYFSKDDQSYYKWPFEAPVEGYINKLSKEKSRVPRRGYKSNENKDVNYLFRVRTRVDEDGNILEARYGKLGGEFGFGPDGEIVFGYYFNPDGTRNLEEDKEKNLFDKK